MPGAVGDEGGLEKITSKRASGQTFSNRFEHKVVTRPAKPLARALSAAAATAFGLRSIASAWAAPARTAAIARMPEPVPTSATRRPARSSVPMNAAKNGLVRKQRGWNTVGGTVKRNPATSVAVVRCRVRIR